MVVGASSETPGTRYIDDGWPTTRLGKMSKAADSEKLAIVLDAHPAETEGQIERLQQLFELVGVPARGKPCEAINGILEEANEIAHEFKGSEVLDAGIIAAQQAVEHYEITRYGTLKSWALAGCHPDSSPDPGGGKEDGSNPDEARRGTSQFRGG
jgi:hypothetical protein